MDISVIPNWLGNSTNIENALSQPWLSTSADILVAIGTIILAIITYLSIIELKKQYKVNYMREKASLIDRTTIPILIEKIDEMIGHLDNKDFIVYQGWNVEPTTKILSNSFIDIARSYSIFNIENEEIYLSYTTDKYIRKYMGNAIDSLNKYHLNASKLERLVKEVFELGASNTFKKDSKDIGAEEFKNNITNYELEDINYFFPLYFLAITESPKSYESYYISCNEFVKTLLDKRFDDLKSSATSDSRRKDIFERLQTELETIRLNLNGAKKDIQNLHEIWQKEFII